MNLSFPTLRPDALVVSRDNQLVIEIDDSQYSVGGVPADQACHALRLLNGRTPSCEIAEKTGLAGPVVDRLIANLHASGVLAHNSPGQDGLIPTALYCQALRRTFVGWKQMLFEHPLWVGLAAGTLPKSVFTGWAIESWWFIEGVMDRLPMAIAGTQDRATRAMFERHFKEEWDHYLFFSQSLAALGLSVPEVRESRPLPSTHAVQHWMRRAARRGPVHYAACSGFLESTGNDRAAARSFFDHLASAYDQSARDAVAPMAAHVCLDEEYEHGSILEKVLEGMPHIDRATATASIQDAYGLVETLMLWSTDILRHYAQEDAAAPRAMRRYRGVSP